MKRRWVCPLCNVGLLAPGRPRRDDVRRYCLPCSAKTGRLVERTCPARTNAAVREQAATQAAAAARVEERARERAEARTQRLESHAAERRVKQALRVMPIAEVAKLTGKPAFEEAARRYKKLKAWEADLSDVRFIVRMGDPRRLLTSGHARPFENRSKSRCVITVGSDIADAHTTILHELAHVAAGPQESHGARWRSFFMLAVQEVTGARVEVPSSADRFQVHALLADAMGHHLYALKS